MFVYQFQSGTPVSKQNTKIRDLYYKQYVCVFEYVYRIPRNYVALQNSVALQIVLTSNSNFLTKFEIVLPFKLCCVNKHFCNVFNLNKWNFLI